MKHPKDEKLAQLEKLQQFMPPHSDEERESIVASIQKRQGILEPIWKFRGKTIDGNLREKVCTEKGIPVQIRELDPSDGSPVDFVIDKHFVGRKPNSSQRAVAALAVLDGFVEAAKNRQRQHGNTAPGRSPNTSRTCSGSEPGEAFEQAAKRFGTNARYMALAVRLRDESPNLLEQVRLGNMSLPEAVKQLDDGSPTASDHGDRTRRNGSSGKNGKAAKRQFTAKAILEETEHLCTAAEILAGENHRVKIEKAVHKLSADKRQEAAQKLRPIVQALQSFLALLETEVAA